MSSASSLNKSQKKQNSNPVTNVPANNYRGNLAAGFDNPAYESVSMSDNNSRNIIMSRESVISPPRRRSVISPPRNESVISPPRRESVISPTRPSHNQPAKISVSN